MKKRNLTIALALLMSGMSISATADLTSFRWFNSAVGNLQNSSGVAIATGGASVLSYLSSDNVINFDQTVLLATAYGDDFYYQALGNLSAGRIWTAYMTEPDGGTDYAGYYTYAVILDMPIATFNTTYSGDVTLVPVGTDYALTPIFGGLTDMDPSGTPPLPDSFNAGSLQTSMQVVPEPATALLFGIGGLGAFIVRRNKKKAQEEADA